MPQQLWDRLFFVGFGLTLIYLAAVGLLASRTRKLAARVGGLDHVPSWFSAGGTFQGVKFLFSAEFKRFDDNVISATTRIARVLFLAVGATWIALMTSFWGLR